MPEASYEFKQALVRDATYESLLFSTQRRIHENTAQALIESARGQHVPEVIAHHLSEAGNLEQAVDYWRRAGADASARLSRPGCPLLTRLPGRAARDAA
jgi:predicted ATPase